MHHAVVRRPALAALLLALVAGPLATPASAAEPEPTPVATTVRLAAPAKVVDEKSVTLTATWRTVDDAPVVAWRSLQHPVVKIWRDHGFRWTYGTGDSQHWDGRHAPRLSGTFVG